MIMNIVFSKVRWKANANGYAIENFVEKEKENHLKRLFSGI